MTMPLAASCKPARSAGRALLGCLLLACTLIAVTPHPLRAQSTSIGTVEALAEKGYARLVFRSETRPDAAAIISNGVLIVQFASPVSVNLDAVPAQLSNYITAAKRDPDGTALRFALSQKLTANVMPLGNALYIDLLPQGWRGFPPPLPAEALTEATVKARRLTAIEAELEQMRAIPHRPLQLSTGTHPTFYRLMFSPEKPVNVSYERQGKRVSIRFNANITVDSTPLRAMIPDALSNLEVAKTATALTITFDVPENNSVRHFEEAGEIIVDIQRPNPNSVIEPAGTPEPNPELTIEPRSRNNRTPPLPPMPQFPKQDPAPKSSLQGYSAPSASQTAFATGRAGGLLALTQAGYAPSALPLIRTSTQAKPVAQAQASPQTQAAAAPFVPAITTITPETLSISLPQATAQPLASFTRGSTVWVVLDGVAPFQADALVSASKGLITGTHMVKTTQGVALALVLAEPRSATLTREAESWTLALNKNASSAPAAGISLSSGFTDKGFSFLQASMANIGSIQTINDPIAGDKLIVVTSALPVTGIAQSRDLLELNILPSAQGLALQPKADDLTIQQNNQGIMITRPEGLALSVFTDTIAADAATSTPEARANPFTAPVWQTPVTGFAYEQDKALMRDAANATSVASRNASRLQLAQTLLAHGETADAKTLFDIMRADTPGSSLDPDAQMLYATTLVLMRQFPEAVEALKSGALTNNPIAALWRGVAEYELGRNGEAREYFIKGQDAMAGLPDRLQTIVLKAFVQSALDAKDTADASSALEALRILPTAENDADVLLLRGRFAEATNNPDIALELYDQVMISRDEISATKAQLYATQLRLAHKKITDEAAIRDLESLATRWRGDQVEITALAELAQLYTKQHRWRDALEAMRTAMYIQSNQESSRTIHASMSELFANLFSRDSDQSAPSTLDSVALFYDFRDLVPPGPTGDVMIRQLVDRLTNVDLLTPAANLLEYQINNRLSGAARSQIAAQAAMLHIMNHNPTAAYAIIQQTRQANLPADLVRNRFILEARALSEMGRVDLAMDMINGYEGQEVTQLRADILWHAERWQPAAEALELAVGERWQHETSLDDLARKNVMRAAIAYVRANDNLGLERLRARFLSKMKTTPDARAFDVVTAPVITPSEGEAFRDVVRSVAAIDSLNSFLEDYKKQNPAAEPPPAEPQPSGSASPATDSPVKGS